VHRLCTALRADRLSRGVALRTCACVHRWCFAPVPTVLHLDDTRECRQSCTRLR
jgi:hypothetical protein